ncbi:MAG: hypothetical protein CH6_0037 [Candidatus Kapaibacterium sp.]|nr:MAG: hypothetical protein CH6_0037 [Candidatus Kapabacteria bacterium]
MMEGIQEPWERLPKEPLKAFKAFQAYRDMGYRRDKFVIAERLGIPYQNIKRISTKWKWEARIDAWEKHLDKVRTEAIKKEVEEMTRRHIQQALIFQRALVLPAEALLNRIRPDKDPGGQNRNFEMLSFDKLFDLVVDAAQTFGKAVDIERKARGEPNEISKVNMNTTETVRVILPKIQLPKENTNDNDNDNENEMKDDV